LNLKPGETGLYYWRGQQIDIRTEPDQPVWTDGEYTGRTPVSIQVLPTALRVAAP
jgi:diacylglycerol kinase family enzyme